MTDYEAFAKEQLPRLVRYSVMLTGDRELAADLVQDVLVKVYRQWPRIGAADRPDWYVMRMVTNQFISWRRSWAVRNIVAVDELPEHTAGDGFEATHAVRDVVWRRLARLPKRQRAVLVLRYYERLTDAEIAEVLECTASTVRGYAHRALASLRDDLNAELMADAEELS
jgi:RNA polymerase sigma-70 factor (sigma-E family)